MPFATEFTPPGAKAALSDLPAFCRVSATLKPSTDSDIKMEVWMPVSGWNEKFMAVGNGGWAGSIRYDHLAPSLTAGYAAASTDTGHTGSNAAFALDHPEKLIDFAYRSEHEMTRQAKAIVAAYYGRGARISYWNGCSSGGRQALKEAQRYPADFDGIIAGDPTNNWTGRAIQSLWVAQAVHKDAASFIPAAKFPAIHRAVLEACDALDGLKDGVIENPAVCKFDPGVLECKGPDGPACLTAPQVESARKIYSGPVNPRSGKVIAPGLEPGSELGWANMAGPQPLPHGDEYFKFVIFANPNWDYRTLNFNRDVALAEKLDGDRINATDPNLKEFFQRGGKLLQYHGWSDQQVAPGNSVDYYNTVTNRMGGLSKVQDSYRLFMVPGMGHCSGGDGTDTFDVVQALESWVEKGSAPTQIPASRIREGKVDRTRPLCSYPQVAKFKGAGSPDDAANFGCSVP